MTILQAPISRLDTHCVYFLVVHQEREVTSESDERAIKNAVIR
ncbi:MAG: hypothetical protein ACNYVW_05135 [Methanosarcinales archaeon]